MESMTPVIVVLVIVALAAGGYYYYKNYMGVEEESFYNPRRRKDRKAERATRVARLREELEKEKDMLEKGFRRKDFKFNVNMLGKKLTEMDARALCKSRNCQAILRLSRVRKDTEIVRYARVVARRYKKADNESDMSAAFRSWIDKYVAKMNDRGISVAVVFQREQVVSLPVIRPLGANASISVLP